MTDADPTVAVLDRIVDGETAVLLLEAGGEVIDERTVAVDALPDGSRHEGAVFAIEDGAAGLDVSYRPEEERDRRARAQRRFDELSERLSEE